jgi:hypothetical protein
MIRKDAPFDRKQLTVNMKESSWYIQGTSMCLRRSLCGHHAPLDTDGWIETPFASYHTEKSPFSKIVWAGAVCRGLTALGFDW